MRNFGYFSDGQFWFRLVRVGSLKVILTKGVGKVICCFIFIFEKIISPLLSPGKKYLTNIQNVYTIE